MNVGLHTRWILTTAVAVGVVGCVTTGANLTNSAERLERSSYELQRSTDYDRTDSGLRSDARELAEEARDFRSTVADSRADERDVDAAFEDLSRSYHALRDEVEHERSRTGERDVAHDFQVVTDAYLDIEREIDRDGEHSRRDRYATDD